MTKAQKKAEAKRKALELLLKRTLGNDEELRAIGERIGAQPGNWGAAAETIFSDMLDELNETGNIDLRTYSV